MAFEDAGLGVVYDQGGTQTAGDSSDDFYHFVLNDLFRDVVADTVITPNTLLTRLGRTTERIEGKDVVFPIHTGRNAGIHAIAAGGLMPDPQAQQYNQYRIPIRHIFGRMKIDGATMDASRTQMASWLNVLTSEAQGLATDLSRYRQRVYHNDGSGVIGHVDSVAASTTQTLTVSTHLNDGSLTADSLTKHMRVGQTIAFARVSDGVIADGNAVQVTAVTATTITVSPAPLIEAAAHFIVQSSAVTASGAVAADGAYKNDPMGIAGIISDANPLNSADAFDDFQGIDSETGVGTTFNQAYVNGNAGDRALTFALMDDVVTTLIETADVAPTAIYGSFGMVRAYYALFPDDRRYNNTMDFDGGYNGLTYDNIPIIADRDSWSNRFYFVYEPDLMVYVMAEPQWRTVGSQTYISAHDRDAFHATMYCRETMASDVRDRQGLLCDITEV